MAWISPTGYNDPESSWSNELNIYDENTSTRADTGSNGKYVELLLPSALSCDKIQIFCSRYKKGDTNANVDVDVFYGGTWHNIHSGVLPMLQWNEILIGSTELVEKARVCANSLTGGDLYLFEFDFNEAEAPAGQPMRHKLGRTSSMESSMRGFF